MDWLTAINAPPAKPEPNPPPLELAPTDAPHWAWQAAIGSVLPDGANVPDQDRPTTWMEQFGGDAPV